MSINKSEKFLLKNLNVYKICLLNIVNINKEWSLMFVSQANNIGCFHVQIQECRTL